jgi:hypothetical protein
MALRRSPEPPPAGLCFPPVALCPDARDHFLDRALVKPAGVGEDWPQQLIRI